MKEKRELINNILKGLIVLTMFFGFSPLLLGILDYLNVDLSNFSLTTRVMIVALTEVLLMVYFFIIYKQDLKKYFLDLKKNKSSYFEIALKWWITGLIVMASANLLIRFFTPSEIAGNEEIVRDLVKAVPWYMLFSAAVYAPFVEEIAFRKVFKDIFKNPAIFIVFSGLAFGLIHVYASAGSIIDYLYVIPYGALGAAFAYAYHKTNNLLVPMSMHFVHNGLLMIIYLLTL